MPALLGPQGLMHKDGREFEGVLSYAVSIMKARAI